jgi:hypothetical protein
MQCTLFSIETTFDKITHAYALHAVLDRVPRHKNTTVGLVHAALN